MDTTTAGLPDRCHAEFSPKTSNSSHLSGDDPGCPRDGTGDFFPHSKNFVVTGRQFISNVTNHITNSHLAVSSDFRAIQLGDLDLRRELTVHSCGRLISRRPAIAPARRLCSARIARRAPDLMVSVYEGDDAEEGWQRELTICSGTRHPGFLQIYGLVRSCKLYAIVFNDDLVPVDAVLASYKHVSMMDLNVRNPNESPQAFSSHNCPQDAIEYLHDISGEYLFDLAYGYMIRGSRVNSALISARQPSPGLMYQPGIWIIDLLCRPCYWHPRRMLS
ncbi:hypothetical protein K438DRAFT_1985789 [Mycena galopus ATCC 62051]|nr:hypothetical protein K438DRAFT_1985789 [Mycena galopus ATCC 62051]